MRVRGVCVGRWQAAEVSSSPRRGSFDARPEMDGALKPAVERTTILRMSSTQYSKPSNHQSTHNVLNGFLPIHLPTVSLPLLRHRLPPRLRTLLRHRLHLRRLRIRRGEGMEGVAAAARAHTDHGAGPVCWEILRQEVRLLG